MIYNTPSIRDTILSFTNQRVPRYTSYPTSPHFQACEDVVEYDKNLKDLPDDTRLSLYLHIPFCAKMCLYCGCHTSISKRYEPALAYTKLLVEEIQMAAARVNPTCRVTNLHFGGGTPGFLEAPEFSAIMDTLHQHFTFDPDADLAIELDPRHASDSKVEAYAKSGITRVSLGIQDFNDKVLETVDRAQPFHLSEDTIARCRAHGINKFNTDIMYGLPYQTPDTMAETFQKLMTLAPDRVAFFGYAHVPWMKKHMRLLEEKVLPDEAERYDLFQTGEAILTHNGYGSIGIDHFAKQGDSLINALQAGTLRRNFQGYTDDTSDVLIGLGVSSIGKTHRAFYQNFPDMPSYKKAIENGHMPVKRTCAMSADDHFRADIIETLMCYMQADIVQICNRHGRSPDELAAEKTALEEYARSGLVNISNDFHVTIRPEALLAARIICSVFDSYYQTTRHQETLRHAKAV